MAVKTVNKKKSTGFGLKLFLWISSITLAVIITFAIYFANYINEKIEPNGTISIPKGATSTVVDSLVSAGYNVGYLDTIVIKLSGGLKYGKFKLEDKNYTRYEFYKMLSTAKPVEMELTLIPGETLEIFFAQISQKHNLSPSELKAAYSARTSLPDGYIFADTYTLKIDAKEEEIVSFLVNISQKRHKELSMQLLGSWNESEWFRKYITMASIIQKESANESEMPTVSSVIYNRLAKDMPLQMDGSLNYGAYSHKKITPARIREDDSTYNTYKHKGLPNYPVCAVSKEAIKAAVNPKSTDYLYFMRNTDGVHSFSKSYGSHLEVIESVKKSNKH